MYENGTIDCVESFNGDITSVNVVGDGLIGGNVIGDVSLGIDFNAVQRRHNGAMECNDGYYMQRLYANGTVQCEKDAVNLMNLGGLLQQMLHLRKYDACNRL